MVLVQPSCAQKNNVSSKWELDSVDRYFITNENEVYDMSWLQEPNDTVKAELVVMFNGVESDKILFSEATIQNDTLKIILHRLSSSLYSEYSICILKQDYFVKFRYLVDVLPEQVIISESNKLKLNTFDFKKGNEVRGYAEFRGRCLKPCDEKIITIKGNFKYIIK